MIINELLSKFNDSFVIGPSEFRSLFILEKNKNLDLDFDYESKTTVLNALFGKYNLSSINVMMKREKIGYDEAKAYLDYYCSGYPLTEKRRYLIDERIIYVDRYSKNLLLSKHVVFLGYSNEDQEILHIIKYLGITDYEFIGFDAIELEKNSHTFFQMSNVAQEVKYVLNDISRRIRDEKKEPKDFIIFTNDSEHIFYLDIFANLYKLPINKNDNKSLFDTYSAKIVLSHLDEDFSMFVQNNRFLFRNDLDNLEIIEYLYSFFDLKSSSNYVSDFIAILKDYQINVEKYVNAIKIASTISFDSNKQYYVIGATDSLLPKNYSDNDYLSDSEKAKANLTISDIKNEFSYSITKLFIMYKNVIHISYPSNNGLSKIAFIIDLYKFKKTEIDVQMQQFSKEISSLFYNDYITKYKHFSEICSELPHLVRCFSNAKTYDNSFKGISRVMSGAVTYSASSMNKYAQCPFSFYCDKVLKLNESETNTELKFGNLCHKILEHVYDKDFNFDDAFLKYQIEFDFDDREKVLLYRYLLDLKDSVESIIKLNSESAFTSTKSEYELIINDKDYSIQGRIDRINLYKDVLIIIDYKSGGFDFNLADFNEIGIGLQLPTYLYLISKSKKFDNYQIGGLFIQPTNVKSFYNYLNPTNDDKKAKELNGIISKNSNYVFEFDKSLEKNGVSSYFSKTKLNKNQLVVKGKTTGYSEDDFRNVIDTLSNWFSEFNDKIRHNEFTIAPYQKHSSKKDACEYCKFGDICYKKKQDYRVISLKKEEETSNGDDN